MILLANLIASRWPGIPTPVVSGLLLATCLGLYFLDLSVFLGVSPGPRAALVAAFTCLPMLFSGLIFIHSFARCAHKDQAFGANLLGSLVGGLLQSVTYWTGMKFLLLLVTVLYAGALATLPRSPSR